MGIVTIVLSILFGLLFAFAGVAKLRRQEPVTSTLVGLGVSSSLQRTIGVLEVLGGLGLTFGMLVQPLGIAAGIGAVALLIGAVIYHVRAGDGPKETGGPAVFGVIAAAVTVLQIVVQG